MNTGRQGTCECRFGPFFTTGYRCRRFRERPFGQPGDFPRGLGAWAGVRIAAKTPPIPWQTRPGVRLDCRFCQGNGLSVTICRASQSSQVISGIRSLQRSACSGVPKRGNVQYSRCLAKRYQCSNPNRRRYRRYHSSNTGGASPTQAGHKSLESRRVPRASNRSICATTIQWCADLRKCRSHHIETCIWPNCVSSTSRIWAGLPQVVESLSLNLAPCTGRRPRPE